MEIMEPMRRLASTLEGEIALFVPEEEPDPQDTVLGEAELYLRYIYSWALLLDKQRMQEGNRLVDEGLEQKSDTLMEEMMVKATYYKALPSFLQEMFWLGFRTQINFWKDGHLFIYSGWRIVFRKP